MGQPLLALMVWLLRGEILKERLNMNPQDLTKRIDRAIDARSDLLNGDQAVAIRLFNGFSEGCPSLLIDLYARTLVLAAPETMQEILESTQVHLLNRLPWVNCVIQKMRASHDPKRRRGIITFGNDPATQIQEHGIWYAIDLMMNQDASLYLDTRNLRRWLLENTDGCSVLNTFAYTGSLGIAALAGGAARVVQIDRSHKFLALARQTCDLNHLDLSKMELRAVNFFSEVARFKHNGALFDYVIADPPIFSATKKGTVNLANESVRVINKLRPLVQNSGRLVMVNNALFLSGEDYMRTLEQLCTDGYLSIETFVPIPLDFTGCPQTIVTPPPVNPTPFNHSTKIVIFRVRRKIKPIN
jgi:23S rRNA (cytosine1962-C5)-methyltransferase